MYAGMMLLEKTSEGEVAESTALQSSIALIAAEEAALCAAVCCMAAATASASVNS